VLEEELNARERERIPLAELQPSKGKSLFQAQGTHAESFEKRYRA